MERRLSMDGWGTVLVAVGSLVACGEGGSGPTPEEHCEELVASCGSVASCCGSVGFAVTASSCEELLGTSCAEENDQGRANDRVFDGEQAARCSAALENWATACDSESAGGVRDACAERWVGGQEPGESCDDDADCAPREAVAVACRDGMCAELEYAEPGGTCEVDEQGYTRPCPPDFYCVFPTDPTCRPVKDAGASCERGYECASQVCSENECASPSLDSLCSALEG